MNYDTYIDLFPSRYIMRVSAGQEGAEGLMPQGLFIIGASDNKLGNARGSTKGSLQRSHKTWHDDSAQRLDPY